MTVSVPVITGGIMAVIILCCISAVAKTVIAVVPLEIATQKTIDSFRGYEKTFGNNLRAGMAHAVVTEQSVEQITRKQ